MNYIRPFAPTFGAKKEVTVAAVATAPILIAKGQGGPIQVRLVNYDTVRVAYRFGDASVVASLTTDPTLGPGVVEVVTVSPNPLGPGDIYFSIVSATSPTGNTFEATPGVGI